MAADRASDALALPAAIVAGIPFSGLGAGAATRATTVVLVLSVGLVGFRLFRVAERRTVGPPP